MNTIDLHRRATCAALLLAVLPAQAQNAPVRVRGTVPAVGHGTLTVKDRSLLVPGANVSLTAQLQDGQPTVLRISAGRDGFKLPY